MMLGRMFLALVLLLQSWASSSADFLVRFEDSLKKGIQKDLAHRMQLPEVSFQVQLRNLRVRPEPMKVLQEKEIRSVEVLGFDQATAQRFDGLANFPVILNSEMGSFEFQVQATVQVTGPVYIASRAIARDEIVSADSFRVSIQPWRQLQTGIATFSARDLAGKRASRFVSAGAPIHPSYLDLPFAVKNGDMVDLTVHSGPGVMIRSRAMARESGRVGEVIDLQQPATKKNLRAVIVGLRKVEVRL